MTDAHFRFDYIVIVIEVNFFFLESADEPFRITVLPRTPSMCSRDFNAMTHEGRDIGP